MLSHNYVTIVLQEVAFENILDYTIQFQSYIYRITDCIHQLVCEVSVFSGHIRESRKWKLETKIGNDNWKHKCGSPG